MKKILIVACIIICIVGILSFQNDQSSTLVNQTGMDSLAAERERFTNKILDNIKGKESEMADSVFKNIQIFKEKESLKASHFLAVMNYWGEALGVSCTHCHNTY